MYEDAVDLTTNEYSRRVVDADEQFYNDDLGFIKSVQEKLKFVPNVVENYGLSGFVIAFLG